MQQLFQTTTGCYKKMEVQIELYWFGIIVILNSNSCLGLKYILMLVDLWRKSSKSLKIARILYRFVKSPYFDELSKVPKENRDRILKIYFCVFPIHMKTCLVTDN